MNFPSILARCELDSMQRAFEQAVDDLYGELTTLQDLVCRARTAYREFIEKTHKEFVELVQKQGWPADDLTRQTQVFAKFIQPYLVERKKVALVMVDALRYELGGRFTPVFRDRSKFSFQRSVPNCQRLLPWAWPHCCRRQTQN